MSALTLRLATIADLPALRELMRASIDALQSGFLSPQQVAASHTIMGLDTQLIEERHVPSRPGRTAPSCTRRRART